MQRSVSTKFNSALIGVVLALGVIAVTAPEVVHDGMSSSVMVNAVNDNPSPSSAVSGYAA